MRSVLISGIEFMTDGRTVWVNDADGLNLGRYGLRGVDVHHGFRRQLEGAHCADCFVRTTDPTADWLRFCKSMIAFHGITVPDDFEPTDDRPEDAPQI